MRALALLVLAFVPVLLAAGPPFASYTRSIGSGFSVPSGGKIAFSVAGAGNDGTYFSFIGNDAYIKKTGKYLVLFDGVFDGQAQVGLEYDGSIITHASTGVDFGIGSPLTLEAIIETTHDVAKSLRIKNVAGHSIFFPSALDGSYAARLVIIRLWQPSPLDWTPTGALLTQAHAYYTRTQNDIPLHSDGFTDHESYSITQTTSGGTYIETSGSGNYLVLFAYNGDDATSMRVKNYLGTGSAVAYGAYFSGYQLYGQDVFISAGSGLNNNAFRIAASSAVAQTPNYGGSSTTKDQVVVMSLQGVNYARVYTALPPDGPYTLAAGAIVPLTTCNHCGSGYSLSGSKINLNLAGTYAVLVRFYSEIPTQAHLEINNSEVPYSGMMTKDEWSSLGGFHIVTTTTANAQLHIELDEPAYISQNFGAGFATAVSVIVFRVKW